MSVLLEAAHRKDLDQVAQVQARGGRVESAVQRDGAGCASGTDGIEIRALGNEAAPLKFVDDASAHRGILSDSGAVRTDRRLVAQEESPWSRRTGSPDPCARRRGDEFMRYRIGETQAQW